MKNFIIPIVILVLVVGVGGFFFINQNSQQSQTNPETQQQPINQNEQANQQEMVEETEQDTSLTGSFTDLLAMNASMRCTFSYEEEGTTSEGTVYFTPNGQKIRGNFEVVQNGEVITTNLITDDSLSYVWTSQQEQGMIIPVTDPQDLYNQETLEDYEFGSTADLLDQDVNYNCSPWVVNDSQFEPPQDIEFVDLSELMNIFQNVENMDQLQNIEDLQNIEGMEQFFNQ